MPRILLLLLFALFAGRAFALDLPIAWDNNNSAGVVTSVEIGWRNPTTWVHQTLAGSSATYTVTNVQPGLFEFEARFCTTNIAYDPPCSSWTLFSSRAPSQPSQPVITVD